MTNETEPRSEWKMSDETRAAIAACREILATAKRDGTHVLFALPSLQAFLLAYASDDYWSDDGHREMAALGDEVLAFFATREADLRMTKREALFNAWIGLRHEVYLREGRAA
jgi:hypothetical protein